MDYSNLIIDTLNVGNTIKLPFVLTPANKSIKTLGKALYLIVDSGASRTSITKEVLHGHGYGQYSVSTQQKRTADGFKRFKYTTINGMCIAKEFAFGEMVVDVLENWDESTVVGVIGLDILTQLTFITSHKHRKFMLTHKDIPEIDKYFLKNSI